MKIKIILVPRNPSRPLEDTMITNLLLLSPRGRNCKKRDTVNAILTKGQETHQRPRKDEDGSFLFLLLGPPKGYI